MEHVKLGSMYLNGEPIRYDCLELVTGKIQHLTVGDTVSGNEIQFVRWGNLLVGERLACLNLSWDDLNQQRLIFGRFVTVDGQQYFCRSPQGGIAKGALNEFDCFLHALAHDEPQHPWFTANWCSGYGQVWCQDTNRNWPNERVVRAPNENPKWQHYKTNFWSPGIGFVPILEPVDEIIQPERLVGQRVKVYGTGASVTGRLIVADDYDLSLRSAVCSIFNQEWINKKGADITIRRDSVLWVRPI